jgi:hypothetical protein
MLLPHLPRGHLPKVAADPDMARQNVILVNFLKFLINI